MRLSLIPALVAGAGLVQVAAVPIRVVIVSKTSGNLIHAIPDNVPTMTLSEGMHMDTPNMPEKPERKFRHHGGCKGRMSRFRQKGIEISNAFRQALGMPLIEVSHPHMHEHNHHAPTGVIRILPFTPAQEDNFRILHVANLPHPHPHDAPGPEVPGPHIHHRPHHHSHGGTMSMMGGRPSFTNRLHYSLMNLGRWEGRAVAFVLGCGIGVLLRMFWVIAIVLYRSFRGSNEDEHEYSHLTILEEYEEGDVPVLLAPPSYTYPVDEKVAVEAEAPVESK